MSRYRSCLPIGNGGERGAVPLLNPKHKTKMKNLIVTRYHGPTNSRGSRISVRGFVPGSGIVRKTYSYDYSGRAHDSAAGEFLREYFPGCIMEEVRMPEDGKTSTGNAYLVREVEA